MMTDFLFLCGIALKHFLLKNINKLIDDNCIAEELCYLQTKVEQKQSVCSTIIKCCK